MKTDVVIAGAGFAGMYMLHRLRGLGLSARVLEAGGGVGGTWYWNRYPGARCDVQSMDYSFSFTPELEAEWDWSEKYATQPEILRYANHVADRFDLRRDIQFETRVASARYDEASGRWRIETTQGERFEAQYYVIATGCLSVPKEIDIPGCDRFAGRVLSHRRLAARRGRLQRAESRCDRHRFVRDPVDPDHRRAGRRADRVPAHTGVQPAGL